jgi:hypothetical protein
LTRSVRDSSGGGERRVREDSGRSDMRSCLFVETKYRPTGAALEAR